jgi:L-threonylcarbamoyladenylate synthase
LNPDPVDKAAWFIRHGGVIAYPTEAVYGLGCDPLSPGAVQRILTLKQRPEGKGLILIAAELAQLEAFLSPLSDEIQSRLQQSWPGPVTWLVPAREETSILLRGQHSTIAVRVTAHPIASALCRRAGMAIVSTSANRSGQAPCRSAEGVKSIFGSQIDFILKGSLGHSRAPSEIRDAISGKIIRPSE